MKFNDLVFSNQRSYKIKRHFLFWFTWYLYFTVTFLIPTNWIPAWNVFGPMPHIEKYGVALATIRILLAALLNVVVHMGLVYSILYFILPRYLSKNINQATTTALLILVIAIFAFINYFNFIFSFYLSTRFQYFEKMPTMEFIIPIWSRMILFNYPTVIGFAVGIKLLKSWHLKRTEINQVTREKINIELELLKSQVHPHFLFNTLNNIYSFIINDSPKAPAVLKKLSAMLHYLIYDCNQTLVKLQSELQMIKDYVDLEKIRYGKNFNMQVSINGLTENKLIAPLLLIPFLENSFKHGASQMLTHPWINLELTVKEETVFLKLSNSKPVLVNEIPSSGGLGLNNVKKRLSLLYPRSYILKIEEDMLCYSVELKIPLHTEMKKTDHSKKQIFTDELV